MGSSLSLLGGTLRLGGNLQVSDGSSSIFGLKNGATDYRSKRISMTEDVWGGGTLHGLWSADHAISSSDRRLKFNIAPLKVQLKQRQDFLSGGLTTGLAAHAAQAAGKDTSGVWALRQLRPVSFRFRAGEAKMMPALGERFGFVAQEVEKVVPNIVHTDANQKGLMYQDILAILTLALQEQEMEIRASDAEVAEAQKEVQELLDHAALLESLLDEHEDDQGAEHDDH